MKLKQLVFLVFCFLLVAQVSRAQGISVERGTLKFASIAAYESFAENVSNREAIRELAYSSPELTTMQERGSVPQFDGDDLYPEFLQSFLNADNIVKIANFWVKIDLENRRGLIADENLPNAYELLAENRTDVRGVMVFSDEEENTLEILEMLQSGELNVDNYRTMSSENPDSRRCPGAARYVDKSNPVEIWDRFYDKGSSCKPDKVSVFGMDIKVVYQKFIIYFSLQTKMKSLKACTSSNWILVPSYSADLSMSARVKYRKRCRDEVRETRVIPSYFNQVIGWRPYEASRSLSHYDFSAQYGIRHDYAITNPFQSRTYRIIANY